MSTTPSSLYPSYYDPQYTGGTVAYQTGNNPVKTAQNQRAVVQSTGDQLMSQDEALANEYATQQGATQSYLNPLEEKNASGQGGYTADQASQIELSPQQQQDIVTGAGISAGAGTASSVGAAERAANAAGGNPAALATYRARAAQAQGADAGQAETGARVAAQQAGSAGAQAVGNAQLAQENQGQNYFGNLQSSQGNQAQTEQGLQQGAYGTQTGGTGAATNSELTASGIPTGTDKLIGAVAGAAGSLADGYPGYMDDGGQDAVVGENGMEAVIENAPKAVVRGASDPVRSNTKFMAEGDPSGGSDASAAPDLWNRMTDSLNANAPPAPTATAPAAPPTAPAGKSSGMPSWLQSYLANSGKTPGTQAPAPGQPGWNKTTPYSQLGSAIGGVARPLIRKALSSPAPVSGPAPFAPGSSQMPMSGGSLVNAGARLPGGLVNRTGDTIDGTPSLPVNGGADYLSGSPDIGIGAESGPMMADGDAGDGADDNPPILNDYLADSEAKSDLSTASTTPPASSANPSATAAGDIGKIAGTAATLLLLEDGRPMMANGKVGTFHWPQHATPAPQTPHMQERAGYQPLGYRAKPMLADGAMPMDAPDQPVQPGNGMQVGNAKVFNKPTMIHLEKADMVVPLGYRAKAKVRPSAALPAMKAAPRRLYGAHAA